MQCHRRKLADDTLGKSDEEDLQQDDIFGLRLGNEVKCGRWYDMNRIGEDKEERILRNLKGWRLMYHVHGLCTVPKSQI